MKDLEEMQQQGRVPVNVHCTFDKRLRHDFIVVSEMVVVVKEHCLECVHKAMRQDESLSSLNRRSRL